MTEYRRSTVLVWPIGATVGGFYSLSGGYPWAPSDATEASWSQHEMVEFLLDTHRARRSGRTSALAACKALHSTSWLPLANGTWDAFIYVAAVNLLEGVSVKEQWPDAAPLSERGFDADQSGPQPYHSAIDPPHGVTWFHTAWHGVRHYRLLNNPNCDAFDPSVAAGVARLGGPETGQSWFGIHLERFRGAPAGNMVELVAAGAAS